tara:strand:+ start:7945 stop:8133 length:189 start_codon:yes stop_codon:yes gene_type:complete
MSEPNWKDVAENFWYACYHGDGGLLDHMVDTYTPYFEEEEYDIEEGDYLSQHLKLEEGLNDE